MRKNKTFFIIIITILFIFGTIYLFTNMRIKDYSQDTQDSSTTLSTITENTDNDKNSTSKIILEKKSLSQPLDNCKNRVTKKPFGIYIEPNNSPVQPERFQGFHTGTDFEVFPEELNKTISVQAICTGKIISKKWVSGYGGVLIQNCQLDNEPITVLYGHIDLNSIKNVTGDTINQYNIIGKLGTGETPETDGERKHLHLSIKKGAEIDLRGYVQNKIELSNWIDLFLYICK